MATYSFTSTKQMAQFLRSRAVQIDEQITALQNKPRPNQREITNLRIEGNAWLCAAEIVNNSVIDPWFVGTNGNLFRDKDGARYCVALLDAADPSKGYMVMRDGVSRWSGLGSIDAAKAWVDSLA